MVPKYIRNLLIVFCVIVFVSIIGLFIVVVRFENGSNTFLSGVYIDMIPIGGISQQEAKDEVEQLHGPSPQKNIIFTFDEKPVATISAQQLSIYRNTDEVIDRAYLVGRSQNTPSKLLHHIQSIFHVGRFDFYTQLSYNENEVSDFVDSISEAYNRPAENALFAIENNRVTSFKKEVYGIQVNKDQLYKDVATYIEGAEKEGPDIVVSIPVDAIEPEVTLSEISNNAVEEVIGIGRSDYSHSISSRIHNVLLAANKFHGVLIPQGTEFSFNKIIGDISARTGYQQAYIIKDGKTVLGDGGGVCQVSTTLFRAAVNTGLNITERHAHAYRVSYYENDSKPGFDATIYSPSVDLRFVNDTPADILIQTEVDETNNLLSFVFYGKSDGRRSEIENIQLWDVVSPPEAVYQDDPTLPSGTVKQIEYPAWGSKASFDYKVVRNNEILYGETFYSNFRPWQAVYLRGTGPV